MQVQNRHVLTCKHKRNDIHLLHCPNSQDDDSLACQFHLCSSKGHGSLVQPYMAEFMEDELVGAIPERRTHDGLSRVDVVAPHVRGQIDILYAKKREKHRNDAERAVSSDKLDSSGFHCADKNKVRYPGSGGILWSLRRHVSSSARRICIMQGLSQQRCRPYRLTPSSKPRSALWTVTKVDHGPTLAVPAKQ